MSDVYEFPSWPSRIECAARVFLEESRKFWRALWRHKAFRVTLWTRYTEWIHRCPFQGDILLVFTRSVTGKDRPMYYTDPDQRTGHFVELYPRLWLPHVSDPTRFLLRTITRYPDVLSRLFADDVSFSRRQLNGKKYFAIVFNE